MDEPQQAIAKEEGWPRVAEAVRLRRTWLGLTQTEAAERAGVSLTTWNLIETARQTTFRPLTLAGVSRALGWTGDTMWEVAKGSLTPEAAASGTRSLGAPEDQPEIATELESNSQDDVMDHVVLNFNAPPHEVPPEVVAAIKNMLRPYFEEER